MLAARVICEGNSHVDLGTKQIIEGDGEGVILRKFCSLYEHGRSSSLVKIKNSMGDMEGMVINIFEDNSLELKLVNGDTFTVPQADVQVSPVIGDIVSFSFEGYSRRDIPVKPSVFRIRSDLSWNDLKNSDETRDTKGNFTSKPIRYWTEVNMRNFLIQYAKEKRELDPLLADTWYTITSEDVRQEKGGNAILNKFKGGYSHAIQHLFPEITFDKTKLHGYMTNDISNRRTFFEEVAKAKGYDPQVPEPWFIFATKKTVQSLEGGSILANSKGGYFQSLKLMFPELSLQKNNKTMWKDPQNRKLFFEWYAKQHDFDPSVAANWYTVSIESVMSCKGARRVMYYHKFSVYQALMDLFPDIGIDKSKFMDHTLWHEPVMRRKFFEDYAHENSFDSLLVANWYSQPLEHIMSRKGAQGVLFYHENSLSSALSDLFPELDIDSTKFESRWQNAKIKRRFFENFAKQQQFDPLVPDNWSPKIRKFLLSLKVVNKIIAFHNNSVLQCLLDMFPDIPWKYSLKKYYWRDISARKRFFENYSQIKEFDPLVSENWYDIHIDDIMQLKGARGVLYYHDNNVSKALVELFPNVSFDKSKFVNQTKMGHVWGSKENRRRFFEKYALDNQFDFRIPSNWYSQNPEKITATKGGKTVVQYHNNSVMQALVDLFPEIGLDETSFIVSWISPTKKQDDIEELEAPDQSYTLSLKEAKRAVAEHKIQEKIEKKEIRMLSGRKAPTKRESLWNEESKRRAFFENYAKECGFDPLLADNWYGPLRTNILSVKGIFGVLEHHSQSVIQALMNLFPEIGLEKSRFFQKWFDISKRRNFFENYAQENGFNPLIAENWYTIPKTRVLTLKGINGVLSYHNNSVVDALIDLFPEIGLDKSRFRYPSLWDSPAKRRQFFEKYAFDQKFDPLVPENWYSIPQKLLLAQKGASSMIFHHGSFAQALIDLYPNVDLDKSKLFPFAAKWSNQRARREFFENYAKEKNFDPLDPLKWYSQKKSSITTRKGAKRMLFYHNNSLSQALLDLFPEIGFDAEVFSD